MVTRRTTISAMDGLAGLAARGQSFADFGDGLEGFRILHGFLQFPQELHSQLGGLFFRRGFNVFDHGGLNAAAGDRRLADAGKMLAADGDLERRALAAAGRIDIAEVRGGFLGPCRRGHGRRRGKNADGHRAPEMTAVEEPAMFGGLRPLPACPAVQQARLRQASRGTATRFRLRRSLRSWRPLFNTRQPSSDMVVT